MTSELIAPPQLLSLSSLREDSPLEVLDCLLTLLSVIDRDKRVGDVVDDWLDVRLYLGLVQQDGVEGLLDPTY